MLGLSQKELASLVEVSHVTLAKIEKNNFDDVKFGTLKKIAKVLKSDFAELFLS